MKNKIISISIMLMFLFISLISVDAIAPTPRVDLDEYQIESTDKNNVFITGIVTIGKGQLVGVYNESGTILYNYTQVKNSNDEETFKLQVPSRYLTEGNNTFKVKSLPIKGVVNSSNPKTVNVKIKTQTSKKDQTITVNNINLKVGETKNLNAKVSSGLPLTYSVENSTIVTVDSNGNVIGRKAGTTKVTIKQAGNNQYNPVSKVVTITVTSSSPTTPEKPKSYTVIFNPNGGKGSMSTQTGQTGKTITLQGNKFSRTDYDFEGWATSKNGKVVYKDKQKIKLTKNITLYARWKQQTYTIVYHGGSNLGVSKVTGSMSKQVVPRGKTVKLYKNKFKKKGYEFVGWAKESNRASKNKSNNVEKFSNINMQHFQLGVVSKVRKPSAVGNGKTWKQLKEKQKQRLTNQCSIKNLTSKNKTIHLYAVWKGNGPESAVDWATLIAKDDNFCYGTGQRAHKGGCYYCGTNISGGKHASKGSDWEKTYCCNPFITAAYVHGANIKSTCKRINGHYFGGMETSTWTCYNSMKGHHGVFKQISTNSKLKTGDIFTNKGHVWMYAGNGKRVEAGSEGWGAYSIHIDSGSCRGNAKRIIRYYPNN